MKFFSLSLAAALAAVFGLGLASHPAAAISIEDSAGNPDATAPLTDPDDAFDSNNQGVSGFTLTMPGQDNSNTQQFIFTMPTSSGSGDGQSQ